MSCPKRAPPVSPDAPVFHKKPDIGPLYTIPQSFKCWEYKVKLLKLYARQTKQDATLESRCVLFHKGATSHMWLLQPKFIQIEINVGESVEKKEISYTVVGNVKQYSHYGKQYWRLLKKLNIELLYDPEIPCMPMFITALFTRAKTWKQPTCS